tara:strand:- start:446 stop:685 length:240 start_codon:yes stop_codon:yes gene_type:complete
MGKYLYIVLVENMDALQAVFAGLQKFQEQQLSKCGVQEAVLVVTVAVIFPWEANPDHMLLKQSYLGHQVMFVDKQDIHV